MPVNPGNAKLTDVAAFSTRDGGFAYRPGEVLVRGDLGRDRLAELAAQLGELLDEGDRPVLDDGAVVEPDGERQDLRRWYRGTRFRQPLAVVDQLRSEGFDAQPNHVFFTHACGCACPPHPAVVAQLASGAWASPVHANPVHANPVHANPVHANPVHANPVHANPAYLNPVHANSRTESTASPALVPSFPGREIVAPGVVPKILVLDSGLAGAESDDDDDHGAPLRTFRPDALHLVAARVRPPTADLADARNRPDLPDDTITGADGTPFPPDGYLDPAAGHGTFIAGLVEQLTPGCAITVRRVVHPLGDVDEVAAATAINEAVNAGPAARPDVISMSFGGPTLDEPTLLRDAVTNAVGKGIALVASAGNDGTCAPQYPAAFPGVVAVAAIGPDGPPAWTNYGDWVDACAPGVELVSWFFKDFDGEFPEINTYDPDRFDGWACWSGTSFAAPVVVAAIARELKCGAFDASVPAPIAAVDRVVRMPYLPRISNLGTIVTT